MTHGLDLSPVRLCPTCGRYHGGPFDTLPDELAAALELLVDEPLAGVGPAMVALARYDALRRLG